MLGGLEWRNARSLHRFVVQGVKPQRSDYEKGLRGPYRLPRDHAGSWNHRPGSLVCDYLSTGSAEAHDRLLAHVRDQNDGTVGHGGGEPFAAGYGIHTAAHFACAAALSTSKELRREVATWLWHERDFLELFDGGLHPDIPGCRLVIAPGLRSIRRSQVLKAEGLSVTYSVLRGLRPVVKPPRFGRTASSGQLLAWSMVHVGRKIVDLMAEFDADFWSMTLRVPFHVWEWADGTVAGWIERNANGNNPPVWAVVRRAPGLSPDALQVCTLLSGKKGGIPAGSVQRIITSPARGMRPVLRVEVAGQDWSTSLPLEAPIRRIKIGPSRVEDSNAEPQPSPTAPAPSTQPLASVARGCAAALDMRAAQLRTHPSPRALDHAADALDAWATRLRRAGG